jgi:hypothetical protein
MQRFVAASGWKLTPQESENGPSASRRLSSSGRHDLGARSARPSTPATSFASGAGRTLAVHRLLMLPTESRRSPVGIDTVHRERREARLGDQAPASPWRWSMNSGKSDWRTKAVGVAMRRGRHHRTHTLNELKTTHGTSRIPFRVHGMCHSGSRHPSCTASCGSPSESCSRRAPGHPPGNPACNLCNAWSEESQG